MPIRILCAHPRPAGSYAEALKRATALQGKDSDEVHPLARTVLMSHGRRTERAIVFFHGYTNSPAQFHRLGEAFYERGYNVLIPRLPHHGLSDRLTAEHALLTADELSALADEAVDIAVGLGEQVTVAGLSMGGVMAAWVAQERPEPVRVVPIAPGLGVRAVPGWLTRAATHMMLRMPNVFLWWDPVLKDKAPGPPSTYPRYSTHALGQMLSLSASVRARAKKAAPAAPSIVVVTNANDLSVDNGAARRLVALWRAQGGHVETYEFPGHLGLPHDLIDPAQPGQRIDIVYPVLIELLMGGS